MKMAKLWLLALLLAAGAAMAGDRYVPIEQRLSAEQRRATGIDTLSVEQLAALNKILSGEHEYAQIEATAKAEAELKSKPQGDPAAAGGTLAGFNDEPIRSRLVGSVSGWEPGTEFKLENGQTWKVLKGNMKLRKPMQAPEIIVVPGLMGRWFLQVHEDFPKARVYRID
jgi:hypothetical protein